VVTPKDSARAKLRESGFFLGLMKQSEKGRKSISKMARPEQEFTYFLSAFLNACYSAAQHLHRDRSPDIEKVIAFQKEHPEFYARGSGLRSLATHWWPVEPELYGYSTPCGSNVSLPLDERLEPMRGDQVSLKFGADAAYYLSTGSGQTPIVQLCEDHLPHVIQFVETWQEDRE